MTVAMTTLTIYLLYETLSPESSRGSPLNDRDHTNKAAFYIDAKKALFIECPFEMFSDLVEKGLDDPLEHRDVSPACRQRALDAIQGKEKFCRHNFYNYQYYRNQTPPDASILAIRTEHLEKDWSSALQSCCLLRKTETSG